MFSASEYAKKRSKDHIARGLCRRCSKLQKEDTTFCEGCLEKMRKNFEVQRNKRIRDGLCVRCGRTKDVETMLCRNCKMKLYESDDDCSRCGGPRDRQKDGRILRVCQACIEYTEIKRINRLRERREAGLCERCEAPKDSSSLLCSECRIKRNASFRRKAKKEQERRHKLKGVGILAISRQRKWQLKHIEMGLCSSCSEKALEGKRQCSRHFESGK